MHRLYYLVLVLFSLHPATLYAQRNATIPDPDPEIEKRSFIVDPRFEVNLYAADPLLAKPIHMNFDAAGRLWIASSEVYPQIKPGQKANDKIIVLEDTKGVGVADKTTVFADGLLIPTGLLPGDGGVYVANSTELIHLSDTKGTGKADKRRVVLSGFGTEDTHHMLHTLRWGPDGRMYMMQSIYIHSHIETPHGPRRLNAGGIWRFKPETMELDVFARGWVNPWGLAFDRYGQAFVTDGAGGKGINYVIPGGYYVTAADAKRVFPGLNPGSPKFCGLEIVSGRHLPDDWQGNLITNDFRGHRVCRFIVKDDGAGFASTEQPELIKSTHPAFRPIDVKMGPDGAIYIADWYNPIIQHGEVDFRDPRRDVTHGRIWRVTAKGRPLVNKPKIEGATTAELLEALKQPEQWTRDMARHEIMEKLTRTNKPESNEAVISTVDKAVNALLREYQETFTGFNHQPMVDMLMLTQSLDLSDEKLLLASLLSKDQGLRAWATRCFYSRAPWDDKDNQKTSKETNIAFDATRHDASPRVRLERIRGVARSNDPQELTKVIQVIKHPMDRFLDYALFLTVRELEPLWLPEFRKGALQFNHPRHMLYAMQASRSPELAEPLLKYMQSVVRHDEEDDLLWAMVAQLGGPKELQIIWEQSLDPKLSDEQRLIRLQALEVAASQRKNRPSSDTSSLKELATSNKQPIAMSALRLIGLWNREKQRPTVNEIIIDENKPTEIRVAALEALAELVGTESTSRLKSLWNAQNKRLQDQTTKLTEEEKAQISKQMTFLNEEIMALEENRKVFRQIAGNHRDKGLRMAAIRCLSRFDMMNATKQAIAFLPQATEGEITQLMPSILQAKNGPEELTSAVSKESLPPDVAKTAIRIARSTGQAHQPLIDALAKAGKLNTAKWEATPVVMKDLLDGVAKEGSAARGELIYRRKELNCLKCHGIGGSGGQIGPDMTSIGASISLTI
ncbi:MAG: sorbosone dehydrogenase [Gemmatales bacterium]